MEKVLAALNMTPLELSEILDVPLDQVTAMEKRYAIAGPVSDSVLWLGVLELADRRIATLIDLRMELLSRADEERKNRIAVRMSMERRG